MKRLQIAATAVILKATLFCVAAGAQSAANFSMSNVGPTSESQSANFAAPSGNASFTAGSFGGSGGGSGGGNLRSSAAPRDRLRSTAFAPIKTTGNMRSSFNTVMGVHSMTSINPALDATHYGVSSSLTTAFTPSISAPSMSGFSSGRHSSSLGGFGSSASSFHINSGGAARHSSAGSSALAASPMLQHLSHTSGFSRMQGLAKKSMGGMSGQSKSSPSRMQMIQSLAGGKQ